MNKIKLRTNSTKSKIRNNINKYSEVSISMYCSMYVVRGVDFK